MAGRDLDAFIKNAKENPFSYDPKKLKIAFEAEEKGILPCSICDYENTNICNNKMCIAWYRWFQTEWQNIQEAAGK